MSHEAERRPELIPIYEARFDGMQRGVGRSLCSGDGREDLLGLGADVRISPAKGELTCTRAAQAYLAASKGAGFVVGHPAERAVREAMFFLVWSCPQPVVSAALREFACVIDA